MRDGPTFQHLPCLGVSYHEFDAGAAECCHTIFLPVNDSRMVALDADSGKPCDNFADRGTLDLQRGMGEQTPGYYEPTSPPIVSKKMLVVGGAVIDNYSTHEPSGVIRGFDIRTGTLVWAWDAGGSGTTPSCNRRTARKTESSTTPSTRAAAAGRAAACVRSVSTGTTTARRP